MVDTPSQNASPTPDELRGGLPRLYLHRSLVRRMAQRLAYVERLLQERGSASTAVFAALDLLYNVCVLIEQVRKVYELIANHVDARFAGARKSLDGRINNRRSAAQQETYQHRAWLFPVLDHVPDSAFTRLGFEPVVARELLANIARRSAEQLVREESQLRAFTDAYADVCAAYKHGRAIFGTEPRVDMTGEKTGSINMAMSDSAATILLSDTIGGLPNAFLVFRPDEEFRRDVEGALAILDVQIPRLLNFNEALVATLRAAIQQVQEGRNEALPALPLIFLGEPYSDEEQRLLDAIREHRLLLYDAVT